MHFHHPIVNTRGPLNEGQEALAADNTEASSYRGKLGRKHLRPFRLLRPFSPLLS